MANVVEILIRARDDASRVMQNVARESTSLGGVLSRIGIGAIGLTAVAGAAAAVGGAMANAAIQLAGTVEQLDRLSARSGVSVSNLQVMRQVIEESGGNADSLTTALTFLNRAIERQDPLLAQLGITTRDSFEAMMQLAKAFERSEDTAKKTEIAFKLLGRGGADLIADLDTLATSYAKTDAAMDRSGKKITDEQLPALRALDAQMDTLKQNWEGKWNQMAASMAGPAAKIISTINSIFAAGSGQLFPGLNPQFMNRAGAGAGVFAPGATGTAAADALAGVKTGTAAEATPREKRLTELMRILGQTRLEAERTLKALEAIDDRDKAQQIKDALGSTADDFARTDTSSDAQLREQKRTAIMVDETRRVPENQLDALTKVREQWRAWSEDVLSTATILNEALGGLHAGLEAGFSQVFTNLLGEGQTFKSAFLTIINSLVEEALRQLARIAAAKAFTAILGFATGGAGSAAGGVVLSGFSISSAGKAPEATKQTIVNINALDIKTSLEAMVTPFGTLRTSETRKLEAFS